MSKPNPPRKPSTTANQPEKKQAPVAPAPKAKPAVKKPTDPLLFGPAQFRLMLIGLGVIVLGMILMMGGSMPSPDVWDPAIIYSPMRITIAPLLITAGLVIEVFAIFKKTPVATSEESNTAA